MKGVTEGVLKIATITVTDLIDRIAVDDDDRRIGAALVGIARFRPEQAVFWRRLAGNGITQDAGQARRSQLGHGCRISRIDRAEQVAQADVVTRRYEVEFGKIKKFQLALQRLPRLLAHIAIQTVPFIHRHH